MMLSKDSFNVGATLKAINKREPKMKRSTKVISALIGIVIAMVVFIWLGLIHQMHSAGIVSLTGIGLILTRLIWVCVDGVDRGGRYGR